MNEWMENDFTVRPGGIVPIKHTPCVSVEFDLNFDANERWDLGLEVAPGSRFTFLINYNVEIADVQKEAKICLHTCEGGPVVTKQKYCKEDIEKALDCAEAYCMEKYGCRFHVHAKFLLDELNNGLTIKIICDKYDYDPGDLASRFHIPLRTTQAWYSGERTPPEYVPSMILRLLEVDGSEKVPRVRRLRRQTEDESGKGINDKRGR